MIEDELTGFLMDAMSDLRNDVETRRLAERLLGQWRASITPAPSRLRELRRRLQRPVSCARLRQDGSCAWLRKHARAEGLRPPGPGERAFCHRSDSGKLAHSFEECAGFSKQKESDL
jgi:hypothetical protein